MKAIYEFNLDCGRMGSLAGLFVADKEEVEKAIGTEVYYGEVLGKHSDIFAELESDQLQVKSDDQDFIDKFESIFGAYFSTGHNPIEYIKEQEEDE